MIFNVRKPNNRLLTRHRLSCEKVNYIHSEHELGMPVLLADFEVRILKAIYQRVKGGDSALYKRR